MGKKKRLISFQFIVNRWLQLTSSRQYPWVGSCGPKVREQGVWYREFVGLMQWTCRKNVGGISERKSAFPFLHIHSWSFMSLASNPPTAPPGPLTGWNRSVISGSVSSSSPIFALYCVFSAACTESYIYWCATCIKFLISQSPKRLWWVKPCEVQQVVVSFSYFRKKM